MTISFFKKLLGVGVIVFTSTFTACFTLPIDSQAQWEDWFGDRIDYGIERKELYERLNGLLATYRGALVEVSIGSYVYWPYAYIIEGSPRQSDGGPFVVVTVTDGDILEFVKNAGRELFPPSENEYGREILHFFSPHNDGTFVIPFNYENPSAYFEGLERLVTRLNEFKASSMLSGPCLRD